MQKVSEEKLYGKFPAPEGGIELIYGHIRNGKTTEGVRRMLECLENGEVVYSNIPLDLSSFHFDDRLSWKMAFWNFLLFRKRFYKFDKRNFHYIEVSKYKTIDDLVDYLKTLTDCTIVWDEGWYLLSSYERGNMDKMSLVLHTGHYNRRVIIIAQRPSTINPNARGNVQVFYRCRKLLSWPFMVLSVAEIQDMANEMPDEDKVLHRHIYVAHKRYFKAFDTHFLRKGVPSSQVLHFEAYDLTFFERVKLLFLPLWRLLKQRQRGGQGKGGGET